MGGRVYFEPRRKILFVVSIRPLTQSQIQWYLPSLVDVGEKGKIIARDQIYEAVPNLDFDDRKNPVRKPKSELVPRF